MKKTVQAIAAIEATKGLVVLIVSASLLPFLHEDLQTFVLTLFEHMHLNPSSKYPHIFLQATRNLHDFHLLTIALGAAGYSILRFIEAYGLFRNRAWAEVFAATSGAIYIPLEILDFFEKPTTLHILLLATNIAVVSIMIYSLYQRRRAKQDSGI